MAFVLTVVFVDLIVALCAELFDPSEEDQKRVELFGCARDEWQLCLFSLAGAVSPRLFSLTLSLPNRLF